MRDGWIASLPVSASGTSGMGRPSHDGSAATGPTCGPSSGSSSSSGRRSSGSGRCLCSSNGTSTSHSINGHAFNGGHSYGASNVRGKAAGKGSKMATIAGQKIRGEAKVWLRGRAKGRHASGTHQEDYQGPWRHVVAQISSRQKSVFGSTQIYAACSPQAVGKHAHAMGTN